MAFSRKALPPADPSEFEVAQQRWHEVRDKRRKLLADLDGARKAFDAAGIRDRESIAPKVREKIETFLAGRRLTGDHLAKIVLDLEAQVLDFQARYLQEAAIWEAARSAEAARRTAQAAPAHAEIVGRIAAAVQELSDACRDEAELLAAVAVVGGSLPCAGGTFGHLAENHSLLSRWRAQMAAQGVV